MAEVWTIEVIADRFTDAASTARRLPRVAVQGYTSAWPTVVSAALEPDGSLQLDVIVEQIEGRMARSISRGTGLAPVLERRYGLNPAAGSLR